MNGTGSGVAGVTGVTGSTNDDTYTYTNIVSDILALIMHKYN